MAGDSMNRVQEHMKDGEDQPFYARYAETAQYAVDVYPIGVTLAVFAAGLGLGAMIGAALADPFQSSQRTTAESIGRKIMNSLSDYVPESMQRVCSR